MQHLNRFRLEQIPHNHLAISKRPPWQAMRKDNVHKHTTSLIAHHQDK